MRTALARGSNRGGIVCPFLMCHDVHGTVAELEGRGVEFVTPIEDEGYGLVTRLKVPGAGLLGLYEPRHPSPLGEFSGR